MKALRTIALQVLLTTIVTLAVLCGLHNVANFPAVPSVKFPRPFHQIVLPPLPEALKVPTKENFAARANAATAALFVRIEDGSLHFACTITMFQKTDTGYLAVTAKHCTKFDAFYVVFDENSDAPYIKAELLAADPVRDCAIFKVTTKLEVPTIPLGTDALLYPGQPVLNVAEPMNLGRLTFHGYVSTPKLNDRNTDEESRNSIGLQLPAAGGSSGSAIFDEDQQAIIGIVTRIVVPRTGGVVLTIATPVSQVRSLIQRYNTGELDLPHSRVFDLFGIFDKHRQR